MSPYRQPCPPTKPRRSGEHCCGICHPAVGGCLRRVTWLVPGALGMGKREIPAGISKYCSTGTPPLVMVDDRWVPEAGQ